MNGMKVRMNNMNRIIGTTSLENDWVTLHVQDLKGDIHLMDVDNQDLYAYANGTYIQDAFPYLTAEQRELILTGTTNDMWGDMFDGDEK